MNGHHYWVSKDAYKSIWWADNMWRVGFQESLGTSTSRIQGPPGNETFPDQVKGGWTYVDDQNKQRAYAEAEIVFKDCSDSKGN